MKTAQRPPRKTAKTAARIMSKPVISIPTETPLRDAAVLLSENGISGALVVDAGERALGVVSLFDIVTHLAGLDRPAGEPGGFYRYGWPRFTDEGEDGDWEKIEENPLQEIPISEIMTPDILSVPADAPLKDVARLMTKKKIHRLFVERDGKPVGVISSLDLLKALAEA